MVGGELDGGRPGADDHAAPQRMKEAPCACTTQKGVKLARIFKIAMHRLSWQISPAAIRGRHTDPRQRSGLVGGG